MKKQQYVKKALFAQYVTFAYNIAESALSIFFGILAGSIALLSFGLDSAIESLSIMIVTWRLRKSGKVPLKKEAEHERFALKLVGYSFIALAVYVAFESLKKLFLHEAPEASVPGMIIALSSIIVMPFLAKYRHSLGHKIKSKSLVADSRQTLLCVYMSIVLLAGIGLNLVLGWWWADPLAGLVIAALAFREGKKALRGEECC